MRKRLLGGRRGGRRRLVAGLHVLLLLGALGVPELAGHASVIMVERAGWTRQVRVTLGAKDE